MILQQIRLIFFNSSNVIAFLVIFMPILVTLYLIGSGMLFHIQTFTWGLFAVSYFFTALGVTVGYHRYLTHRSFKTGPVMKTILVGLGCMAFEGSPSFWVGAHRKHHVAPDTSMDPHSPYHDNKVSLKTFIYAHFGWMLYVTPNIWYPYVRDLRESRIIRFFNAYYLPVALMGLFIPAIINGLYFMSWYQFWIGFLICGVFRVCLLHQVTWSVNSVGHILGKQHFDSSDNSKNNLFFGFCALGDGWHNGHHAFPGSAKHGLLWWQMDVSYLVIKLLGFLGLATNIKVPDKLTIEKKRNPKKL